MADSTHRSCLPGEELDGIRLVWSRGDYPEQRIIGLKIVAGIAAAAFLAGLLYEKNSEPSR